MFFPTTQDEIKRFGWKELDIVLITGDTYIDSPYIGVSIIANLLFKHGYKVGVIAQPDINTDDIARLGEPKLFWGVTAGSIDSMVANYTALKKFRKSDDFTPGGKNDKRPDRASITYTNLIRKYFKNTKPIVLGGIEASLRRIPHYDFWDDKLRRSLLFDAKADIIVYGMGEKTILELAECFKTQTGYHENKGICYISKEPNQHFINLPSYEEAVSDKNKFIEMFNLFYNNIDPILGKGLTVKHGDRYLIQNPPQLPLNEKEMDEVYGLNYTRDVHPYYKKNGEVKALETIRFSITTHRGCYGECNFCAISLHQGKFISSRSEKSIVDEAKVITHLPGFKGYILDVGGPTANMYGIECDKKLSKGACSKKRCIFPYLCNKMVPNHIKQINLLRKLRSISGIKKVFIGSGLRYDIILDDIKYGQQYLEEISKYHISGQLKIAPEHINAKVLRLMGKPENHRLPDFRNKFYHISKKLGDKQFLTYYFIAAHPGSDQGEMLDLKKFIKSELKLNPEQVQIFTPTPSTYSTLMYYTEIDPFTNEKIFVEKKQALKEKQKKTITG
jgi:uncharacterized radical SAM protein YgiQ